MYIKNIFVFLGLVAFLAGCGGVRDNLSSIQTGATTAPSAMQYGTYIDSENHRIAVLLPTTGDAAVAGRAIRSSVEMATLSAGAENLDVSFYDSARGVDAINDMLAYNPEIVIGPLFANDARMLRKSKSSDLPVLSFTSDVTAVGDGVMTMALMPTNSIEAIIREMRSDGVHNFVVLAPNTESGYYLGGVARVAADVYNVPLVGAFFYTEKDTDSIKAATQSAAMNAARTAAHTRAREILSDILTNETLTAVERSSINRQLDKLSKNDVIGDLPYDAILFLGSGDDTKSLASFMRYFGVGSRDAKMYGTAMWDGADIASDITLSGAKYAALPDTDEYFSAAFERVAGVPPSRIASFGYDAANMAIGMLYSGKKPNMYLFNPSGYTGVDGIVRIQPTGVNERALRIMQLAGNGEVRIVRDAATDFIIPLYSIDQRRITPIKSDIQLQTPGVNPLNFITIPERVREKYKSKTYGANMTAATDARPIDVVTILPEDDREEIISEDYKPVKLSPVKQTLIDSIEVEE